MSSSNQRVVIKIGTSILTDSVASLETLAREIAALKKENKEVLLVTSGAIGAGLRELGWSKRPDEISKKQAAAAIGQVTLMQTYQRIFKEHGVLVAQILLTRSDFEDRKRYLNARNTLLTLLELGVVPIINENDTVAVEEIQFGDNDKLSAMVAAKIDADVLIILSNVDGILDQDGQVVPVISSITSAVEGLAWKGVKSELGTGGMTSKIEAAKITTASGVTTVIAGAARQNVVTDILNGKNVGTKFISAKSLSSKARWILFGALPKGEILVDEGAVHALKVLKKSLLPAGIVSVKGDFDKGDVVRIKAPGESEFARGIVSFSAEEIERVKGQKSSEIKKILTTAKSSEVIHRDQLAILP